MSALGRAILRLAACVALRDATVAAGNVFDSVLGTVAFSGVETTAGAIVVYTEQDKGYASSYQNGGPPFVPNVDLILEISVQARVLQPDNSYLVQTAAASADHEATLDTIETQAELELFRSYASNAVLFRKVAKRPKQKLSRRYVDQNDVEAKFAKRIVAYKIEILDPEISVFDTVPTGLDRLPEPFRSVALGWPSGAEKDKATSIAALLVSSAPPALTDVRATATPPASTQTAGTDPNPSRVDDWNLPQ